MGRVPEEASVPPVQGRPTRQTRLQHRPSELAVMRASPAAASVANVSKGPQAVLAGSERRWISSNPPEARR